MNRLSRRGLCLCGCGMVFASVARAEQASTPSSGQSVMSDLVAANRILYDQGLLDGFGHVSASHPENRERFFLARSMAPGLVTESDIMEFDLSGAPIDARGRAVYLERFIHSEIYRARPDVNSVVHSHSPGVIPFGAAGAKLRPIYHMSSFLAEGGGDGVPIFEIRDVAGPATDMLIRTPELGRALAQALGPHSVALMRGHGDVVVGRAVRRAVFRAIYTEINARLEADALRLGAVTFLNDQEAAAATATNDALVNRPWDLWRKEAMGE